jgi:hypothetical protein
MAVAPAPAGGFGACGAWMTGEVSTKILSAHIRQKSHLEELGAPPGLETLQFSIRVRLDSPERGPGRPTDILRDKWGVHWIY